MKALKSRYHSVKKDYKDFLDSLHKNPLQGASLGKGIRKVRMAMLLTIYDKSERSTMTNKEIKALMIQCGI